MSCDAYVVGQSYICPTCNITWDINDPEPPECGNKILTREEVSKRLHELECAICGDDRCEVRQGMHEPCETKQEDN